MSECLTSAARRAIEACLAIAAFSEEPGNITRTFLSPPVHETHGVLQAWMKKLKMEFAVDSIGNLRGLYRCGTPRSPRLLIGSHIDTVPNAGAFDGVLGVVLALTLLEELQRSPGTRLDYDIEVVAFSEEEGVRFAMPFLGSRALIGDLDLETLQRKDASGTTIAEAVQSFGLDPLKMADGVVDPGTIGFVEFHIEQGPVLESLDRSLGVVTAIAGQSRFEVSFCGRSNHAGTTPMFLREDALAGAAEWILAVERRAAAEDNLVATVGRLAVLPGAANVIPGEVRMSLDVRHPLDERRIAAAKELLAEAVDIAARRRLRAAFTSQLEQPATPLDESLTAALETAARAAGACPVRMISGAGHDAMVLARRVPAAMLFLRSPGGISHHPQETVLLDDVRAALAAGLYFLKHLNAASMTASTSHGAAAITKGT